MIVPCLFSDHNASELEIKYKKKFGRNSNTWSLKNALLKDERLNQEIREKLKRFKETNENEDTSNCSKSLGYSKTSPKRKIHRNRNIPQKIVKNSNTQANLAPKGTRERTANKTYTKQKRVNKDSSRTQ